MRAGLARSKLDTRYRVVHVPILLVRACTYGLAAQKAKRNPVLSQLMALSETSKYSAEVVEMEEKVSH
jgi:hypothetical protein